MITFSKKGTSLQTNDEDASMGSSRKKYRKLERSTSRHSSRSQSKDQESSNLSNFYVKNMWTKSTQQLNSNPQYYKLAVETPKKREPTPVKSRKLITTSNECSQKKQAQKLLILQKKITIDKLTNTLSVKTQTIQKLQTSLQQQQQKIKNLQSELDEKQQKNNLLVKLNKQGQRKIMELQEKVLQSQQNIVFTNNALEKLRKNIQENRIQDLKVENQNCRLRIGELEEQVDRIQKEINIYVGRVAELEKENNSLKAKRQLQSSFKAESMKQAYLQGQIARLKSLLQSYQSQQQHPSSYPNPIEQEQVRLKGQIKNLNIKLDYINRKHMQDIRLVVKSKEDSIAKYKKKCKQIQLKLEIQSKKNMEANNYKGRGRSIPKQFKSSTRLPEERVSHDQLDNKLELLNRLPQKHSKSLSSSFELSSDND